MTTPPRVIGLIGGIGSGKSRVAEEFARRGAVVVSGDAFGHEALRQPDVRARIVGRWGPGVVGDRGEVVRRRLAEIVFADPGELKALEAIVHPYIGRRLREEVERLRADPAVPLVVVDAAVMLEAGWDGVCDRLVFVDAPAELRRRRVAERRGWSAAELAAREAAQLPLTAKAARADHTLDNSGPPDQLSRQVDELFRHWGLAPAPATPPAPSRERADR
jgi:dephospho-CoA kinase